MINFHLTQNTSLIEESGDYADDILYEEATVQYVIVTHILDGID